MTFQEILDKLQEANQTEKHSCQCLSRQAPRLPEKSRVPEGPGQPWVGPALPWEPRWPGGATLAHGARTSSRLRLPLRFALHDSATGGRSPHRCRRGGGGCAAKAHVLCHPRTWPGVLGRMGCKLRDPPRTGPAYSRPHQVTSGCGLAAPSCPQGGDPQAPQPCTSPFMKAGKLDLQGRWSGSHSSWRPQASSEDSPFPFQGRLRSCVCVGGRGVAPPPEGCWRQVTRWPWPHVLGPFRGQGRSVTSLAASPSRSGTCVCTRGRRDSGPPGLGG